MSESRGPRPLNPRPHKSRKLDSSKISTPRCPPGYYFNSFVNRFFRIPPQGSPDFNEYTKFLRESAAPSKQKPASPTSSYYEYLDGPSLPLSLCNRSIGLARPFTSSVLWSSCTANLDLNEVQDDSLIHSLVPHPTNPVYCAVSSTSVRYCYVDIVFSYT